MNPSTEDFVKAVSEIPSKVIYILPNNKNIILAAGQVNELVEDKEIYVIPTKTIPQGVSALIAFDTTVSPEENVDVMTQMSEDVKTGQVTFAVRDTSIDSKPIQAGDILGISDDGIAVVNKDIKACTFELIDTIVDSMSELVTIYYGDEVEESQAQVIAEYIKDKYEDVEIEVHYGGQPLYYYIISVE
jgi:dihydroxyacetone kinase-like predicted kinase